MFLIRIQKAVYLLLIFSLLQAKNSTVPLNQIREVNIDGYLDDAAWKGATKITDFNSFMPEEGQPVVEKTAMLLGYDADNFYIAFICFYKDPSKIRSTITPRDDIFEDDFIIFYLDTFNDGKNAYQFAFNPYGIQADGIYTEHVGEDFKPDFLFESTGRIFSQGYIIEARIPFSSLNFPDNDIMDWRFAVLRRIQYNSHDVVWPVFTVNSTDWIGQFGTLTGIHSIHKGKGLEILPEFTSSRTDQLSDSEEKLQNGPIKGEAGVNFKLGVSAGLNLDLTYNPDFSQVEADANKIDINRVTPLYYEEKRPFFLEGTEIFSTPIEAFYSRQIVDPLAGIKLSGRSGNYSVGFLSALDDYQGSTNYLKKIADEKGASLSTDAYNALFDTLKSHYYAKRSLNNILRIKRNIFDKSSIGVIATDREFEDSYNRVYGVDGRFVISDNDVLTLQGLYAQTRELDSFEKLNDPAFYGDYWHGTNTWNFQLFYNDYAPDFRLQNGFITRTDILTRGYRDIGVGFWYDFRHQEKTIQHFRPYLYVSQTYNYKNQIIEQFAYSSLMFHFDFQTDLTMSHQYYVEGYTFNDNFANYRFAKNSFSIDLSNKSLAWFNPSIYYYFGDEISYYAPYKNVDPFLGKVNRGSTTFILKPFSNLSTELTYNFYRFNGQHQSRDSINFNFASTQQIVRAKINYQLSRYLALRLIMQNDWINYDDVSFSTWESGDTEINFLFSYVPSPGTVIYLGYNDFRSKMPGYNEGWILKDYLQTKRGFFMKLSYLFKTIL